MSENGLAPEDSIRQLEFMLPTAVNWSNVRSQLSVKRPRSAAEPHLDSLAAWNYGPAVRLMPMGLALRRRVKAIIDSPTSTDSAPDASASPRASVTLNKPQPAEGHAFDYNVCLDALRSNSKKPFAACTSSITDDQHIRYSPLVLAHLSGSRATSRKDTDVSRVPEKEALLDIVEREQTLFLQKWHEFVVACPLCLMQPARCAQGKCLNYSYCPKELSDVTTTSATQITDRSGVERLPSFTLTPTNSAAQNHRSCRFVLERIQRPPLAPLRDDMMTQPSGHVLPKPFLTPDTNDPSPPLAGLAIPVTVLQAIAVVLSVPAAPRIEVPFSTLQCEDGSWSLTMSSLATASQSTRDVLTAAYTNALLTYHGIPLSGVPVVNAVMQAPSNMSPGLPLHLPTTVCSADTTERVWLPFVKLHYHCKPGLPPQLTHALEEFGKSELVQMHLVLSLHPNAHLLVHHVDAYSGRLLSIQAITPATFSTIAASHMAECTGTWPRVVKALKEIFDHTTKPAKPCSGWMTISSNGFVEFHEVSQDGGTLQHVPEYRRPGSWPMSTRIPLTFISNQAAHVHSGQNPVGACSRLLVTKDAATATHR